MATLREKILSILEQETGVDTRTIDLNAPIRDQVPIDSMLFVGILAALESELNVEIPTSVVGASTLAEFIEMVTKAVE